MILWICPNGSMGLQIFVSADPAYRPVSEWPTVPTPSMQAAAAFGRMAH